MNKRLEQEFNNFIDRLAIKESLAEGVPPSMFNLQRVAERFYNLALADVREEVAKLYEEAGPAIITHEGGLEAYFKRVALKNIAIFIDNLTK